MRVNNPINDIMIRNKIVGIYYFHIIFVTNHLLFEPAVSICYMIC